MKQEIEQYLMEFQKIDCGEVFQSSKYKDFEKYVNSIISGNGMVGENSYLSLWSKKDIEELNYDYQVEEYLKDCILIGSDGGDTAYGINRKGEFFSVPFIGMEEELVEIIAENYETFIEKLFRA